MRELLLLFRQQSKRLTGSVAFFGFCISEMILLKQIQGLSSCRLVQQMNIDCLALISAGCRTLPVGGRWCRVETLFGVVKNAAWVNGLGREHVVRLGRRVSLFNIFTPAGALKHTACVTSIPGTPCAPHISSLARPAVSAHLLCVTAGPCAVNSITLFLHRLDYIQECTLHMHTYKDTDYPTSHGCDLAKSCMYSLNYPN